MKYNLMCDDFSFYMNVAYYMVYKGLEYTKIDVYYNDHGHPKYIHDEYGALAVEEFEDMLIDEIKARNNPKKISSVGWDAFAIESKEKNSDGFEFYYKDIKCNIKKKTFEIREIVD